MRSTLFTLEFRYWNANEGKEYFSEYRYTMVDRGRIGSFAPGEEFKLVLRETPFCDTCRSCTKYMISVGSYDIAIGLPQGGFATIPCVEIKGTCETNSTILGFPGLAYPCVNDDEVDCTSTFPSPPKNPSLARLRGCQKRPLHGRTAASAEKLARFPPAVTGVGRYIVDVITWANLRPTRS